MMRTSARLGVAALLAATTLAAALGTASARNLEISAQGILSSWSRLELQTSAATVRCPITLDGSFHSRTIPKTVNLLVGAITEVRIKEANCTNGSASINNATLPWHIVYTGFTGTLPAIISVRPAVERFRFTTTLLGIPCAYGAATDRIVGAANLNAAGEVTELSPVAGSNIVNIIEGRNPGELFGCPRTGSMAANASDGIVNVLNNWTTRIRVRLI
jgi:hypothetical protein